PEAEIRFGFLAQIVTPPQASKVVLVPLRGIGENDESLGDFAKVLDRFRLGIDVGVKRAGKLPVDCLDVAGGGVVGNTEHVVQVPLRHRDKIGVRPRSGRRDFRVTRKRVDPLQHPAHARRAAHPRPPARPGTTCGALAYRPPRPQSAVAPPTAPPMAVPASRLAPPTSASTAQPTAAPPSGLRATTSTGARPSNLQVSS